MRNSGWQAMGGADTDGVQRYGMIGFDGATVHGWVQASRQGQDPVIGYASANLNDLVEDLKTATGSHQGDGADVGLFGIGKVLKKLARKTGVTKVLKKATKLADYALSNPLVKGALAATGPMGMSVIAAHQGYRMLKKYAKGNPKAMRFVKGIVRAAQGGNPKAIKIQRMLRLGQRAFGPGAMRRYAVRRAGTPARYGTRRWGPRYQPLCPRGRVSGDLQAIAGADVVELGKWMAGGGAGAAYMGDWEISGDQDEHRFVAGDDAELGRWIAGGGAGVAYMGDWEISGDHQGHAPGEVIVGAAEDAEVDEDIADLNEFAASAGAWEGIAMLGDDLGAFEGLAWAADRMGYHSMAARPNELTARDALLDGRQGQAARFAM